MRTNPNHLASGCPHAEEHEDVFFVDDHFRKYEWTLARIDKLSSNQMHQIMDIAWRNRLPGRR